MAENRALKKFIREVQESLPRTRSGGTACIILAFVFSCAWAVTLQATLPASGSIVAIKCTETGGYVKVGGEASTTTTNLLTTQGTAPTTDATCQFTITNVNQTTGAFQLISSAGYVQSALSVIIANQNATASSTGTTLTYDGSYISGTCNPNDTTVWWSPSVTNDSCAKATGSYSGWTLGAPAYWNVPGNLLRNCFSVDNKWAPATIGNGANTFTFTTLLPRSDATVSFSPIWAPYNKVTFNNAWQSSNTVLKMTFSVAADRDAIITLSPTSGTTSGSTVRTITIGSYTNTNFIFRTGGVDVGVVNATVGPPAGSTILSGQDTYVPMWLTYDKVSGLMKIGKGSTFDVNVLVSWTDPSPMTWNQNVFIGFGGWISVNGVPVFYKNIAIAAPPTLPTALQSILQVGTVVNIGMSGGRFVVTGEAGVDTNAMTLQQNFDSADPRAQFKVAKVDGNFVWFSTMADPNVLIQHVPQGQSPAFIIRATTSHAAIPATGTSWIPTMAWERFEIVPTVNGSGYCIKTYPDGYLLTTASTIIRSHNSAVLPATKDLALPVTFTIAPAATSAQIMNANECVFAPTWKTTSPGVMTAVFTVQATTGVAINFVPTSSMPTTYSGYYSFLLGYNDSQTVAIVHQGVQMPSTVVSGLLDGTAKTFWVSSNNGTLAIGRGSTLGQNVLLSWTDPSPITNGAYVAFTGPVGTLFSNITVSSTSLQFLQTIQTKLTSLAGKSNTEQITIFNSMMDDAANQTIPSDPQATFFTALNKLIDAVMAERNLATFGALDTLLGRAGTSPLLDGDKQIAVTTNHQPHLKELIAELQGLSKTPVAPAPAPAPAPVSAPTPAPASPQPLIFMSAPQIPAAVPVAVPVAKPATKPVVVQETKPVAVVKTPAPVQRVPQAPQKVVVSIAQQAKQAVKTPQKVAVKAVAAQTKVLQPVKAAISKGPVKTAIKKP